LLRFIFHECEEGEIDMSTRSLRRLAIILAIAGTSLAAIPVRAQEPTASAIATARELLTIKGALQVFEPAVPGVIESVKNSLLPTNLNVSRELNEVAEQLHKEYTPKRAEIITIVARAYARHFTEQEMKQMITFYKSPLGQKMLKEEPAAADESFKDAQEWANTLSETVMARFRSEMAKKGHPL
jgi:uncharacterized protein